MAFLAFLAFFGLFALLTFLALLFLAFPNRSSPTWKNRVNYFIRVSETLLRYEYLGFWWCLTKFIVGIEIEFTFLKIHILSEIEIISELFFIFIEPAEILEYPHFYSKPIGSFILLS